MFINIFKKPEILNKELHKDLMISNYENYQFSKDAYIVPIGLNEMIVAQKSLIIVFIKEANKSIFPAVILGGEKSGNLLLTKENNWKENRYIPAALRSYPFGIGNSEHGNFITVDVDAEVLKSKDGKRIIQDDQSFTEQGEYAMKFVHDSYGNIEEAKNFTSNIETLGILKQANITIEIGKEKHELTQGIYVIDENSLNKLESRKLKKLATQGFMKYIYSHLLSLNNKY